MANNESPDDLHDLFKTVNEALSTAIIGQPELTERLLIALLSDGHLLVEGAPGLAKTRAIKALSALIDADFHRIQFTPDLLPSDLTGTDIYQPQNASFVFQPGPIFHSLILADEINRAPAKVQSALLEAMAERQITIGRTTHTLPPLFMVMATQNPIEQEGTFPLPEAQLDRFLLHVKVDYPAVDAERKVMKLARSEARMDAIGDHKSDAGKGLIDSAAIMVARQEVLNIHLSDTVEEYIAQLILATRRPGLYDDSLSAMTEYGASPRGSIGLERAARAHAWLRGRDYVSPDDVQAMAHDVLRHRVLMTFSAEASGFTADNLIDRLLDQVPVA
ncbi:MAG: MoxR family ATPase [Pseudomonadota bacterium]